MDFSLTETQSAVRGVVGDVLDRDADTDSGGWKALAGAGLLGLAVPERHGGEGLGLDEVAVLLHEAGRRANGLPIWETLACGALTIATCGTEQQQADLLPEVVTGESVLTAALVETGVGIPAAPRTTLRRDGSRLLLSGRKLGVSHASEADRILVSATMAESGSVGVVLLDPAAPGVTMTATPASRGDGEATVAFDDIEVSEDDIVGGPEAEGCGDTLRRLAVAGSCLFGDGLVAGTRDLTAGYVSERHQFGKPLAQFQAVAQQMADVYVASRTIGLSATSAAWRLGAGLDADDDLAVAAYWFTAEGPPALHICHHLHGGMGVDVSYPLHTYYSWVRDIARRLGGTQLTLDAVADRQVGA